MSKYQQGKPIDARPLTRLQRGWRWCRRKPLPAAAALAFGLLVLAIVGILWLSAENRREQLYIADMNVAMQCYDDNNLTSCRVILERHTPKWWQSDLRQFEWYWLQNACQDVTPKATFDAVPKSLSYDPQKGIVTGLSNGEIVRFSVPPGDFGRKYELPKGRPHWRNWAVVLPSDGATCRPIQKGPSSFGLKIGEAVEQLVGVKAPYAAASTSDGALLAVLLSAADTGAEPEVHILNRRIGEIRQVIVPTSEPLECLEFSPDGALLIAGGRTGILGWRVGSWQLLDGLPDLGERVNCLAFDQDIVAIGQEDGGILIHRLADWRREATLRAHRDGVRSLTFSRDRNLVSGSRDNSIKIWKPTPWREWRTLKGHSGIVNAVLCFQADDGTEWLASAAQDYAIRFWSLAEATNDLQVETDRPIRSLVITGHGAGAVHTNLNLAGPGDSPGLVNDPAKESISWLSTQQGVEFKGPAGVPSLAPQIEMETRDCVGFVVKDTDTIVIRDLPRGKSYSIPLNRLDVSDVNVATVSENRQFAAIGLNDGSIRCIDLQGKGRDWIAGRKGPITALAFNGNGTQLAIGAGMFDTAIWIYSADTGAKQNELAGHKDTVLALEYSPTREHVLVSGSFDNTICVWDDQETAPQAQITAHTASVHDLLFSRDGRTMVSAGGDRTVRVWDTQSWRQRAVLRGHRSAVYCVGWAENEEALVSGGGDRTIRVWRAPRP